jgi:hypothetical protein
MTTTFQRVTNVSQLIAFNNKRNPFANTDDCQPQSARQAAYTVSRLTKPPHTMVGVAAEVVRRTWATLAGDYATNDKVRVGCNDLA